MCATDVPLGPCYSVLAPSMTSWQKRARLAVAAFGLTTAVAVYFAIGERRSVAPPVAPSRLEPKAVSEAVGGRVEQVNGSRQTFLVHFDKVVSYEDGTERLANVRIESTNTNGRRFVVTAQEGRRVGKDTGTIELRREIRLRESDGFELLTEQAVYDFQMSVARADGDVTFSKGGMRGSGRGTSYDQRTDVLRIDAQARVDVADVEGSPNMHFSAGTASLDRMQHLLILDKAAHVEQDAQITDADRATARLSAADDVVTSVELRGNAMVRGASGALDSMRAGEIDLDYAADGRSIENAVLRGGARIELDGAGEGAAGREFAGDRMEVLLDAAGAILRVAGQENVHVTLPASGGTPPRRVESRSFEATGMGGAVTDVRFDENVVYREQIPDGGLRLARSRSLALAMRDDAIDRAVFSADVTFEEQDLKATAKDATYQPAMGTLRLSGSDARGRPRLVDERITIEAARIDLGLEGRRVEAAGQVKTSLKASRAGARGGRDQGRRLPGLLRQDEQASVVAPALTYAGADGTAVFSGGARLWQGETEIDGEWLELRQQTGDLTVRGKARSKMSLDSGRSDGWADEIRYTDAERHVTYLSKGASKAPGPKEDDTRARLTGPQGDVRALRIDVRLAAGESRVERVDAQDALTAVVDNRTVKGGSLTYTARDDRYEVRGARGGVATVEETMEEACRVATSPALTFTRSTDTMSTEGGGAFRTALKRSSDCERPAR